MEIFDQTTCLDPYFASFEESLSSRNYKPETLTNYRYLLRRFGRLLDIEGIAPSALTPDLAVELGRRLPTTPKSQIKVPNLAKLFVAHLIEVGVATRPPLTPAQAERAELLSNFETYLLRQRGLSPRSVYHVLRFADRFLDHRFGDHMLDLPALNARDVVAFMEHLLKLRRPMGKFIDPIKIDCPACGKEALHSLASLRALQAECSFCHLALREAGERISEFEREIQNGVIAMAIELVVEKLDNRIEFRAEDLKDSQPVCLNDVIAEVAAAMGSLPPINGSPAALVEGAIKEMLPSIDCPPKHLPMVDVFAEHIDAIDAYHFRGWKRAQSDKAERDGS